MFTLRNVTLIGFFLAANALTTFAQDGMGQPCPWWRPCGPGNTWGGNPLFYQGAYGADFRPACAFHDECLMNPLNGRKDCDRAFRDRMYQACECSTHPILCRHKANMYYLGCRMFGGFYRP